MQFRTHYGEPKIGKWDISYYVYGLLHHPGYRTKFADNFKRELPRIPMAPQLPSPPGTPGGEGRVRGGGVFAKNTGYCKDSIPPSPPTPLPPEYRRERGENVACCIIAHGHLERESTS